MKGCLVENLQYHSILYAFNLLSDQLKPKMCVCVYVCIAAEKIYIRQLANNKWEEVHSLLGGLLASKIFL